MKPTNRRHLLRLSALSTLTACACAWLSPLSAHAAPADDVASIRHVLMRTFDRPEARLRVDPVVVLKGHAVAAWQQDDRGGRALMRRTEDGKAWEITLCAGDGLTQPEMLEDSGLNHADARTLAQAVARAESTLDAATKARLASFQGVVRMGPGGEHPPVDGHGAHGGHGAQGAHGAQGGHGGHGAYGTNGQTPAHKGH